MRRRGSGDYCRAHGRKRRPGFDAESLLRSLMENVPGAIYRAVNDSEWTVLRVNDEIETITGYPAADFVDASVLNSVTHPDDLEPVERAIDAALSDDRPWVLEYRIVRADGGIRWVHERGVKTVDRDGREWIDGIIFDVTERRTAEQLRVERELEALRVAELEAARTRIIAAGDEARRRIERDLHDGAQQRSWSRRCSCARPSSPPSRSAAPRRSCGRRTRS